MEDHPPGNHDFAAVFASMQDAVLLTTPNLNDLRIVYANPAFTRMSGYTLEDVRGKSPELLNGPKTDRTALTHFQKTLEAGRLFRDEAIHYRKDGVEFSTEWHAEPVKSEEGRVTHYLFVYRDVSAKRRADDQVVQQQKLHVVGMLAGSIAHDFNNVMTVIMGYADLTLNDVPPGHPLRRRIEAIRDAGEHASLLTRRLLATSRRQQAKPVVLDMNPIVTTTGTILRRVIGQNIELILQLAPKLQNITADPTQVEQILFNLAMNARDAMPSGGKLTFETRDEGSEVVLAVRDTGVGISAENLTLIFEPFFTTKPPGKGTGLGLTTVWDIVGKSNARITVSSQPGKGSTFSVYFPAVAAVPANPLTGLEPLPAGRETVLVVDDEAGVRDFIQEVLSKCGYTVLCAKDVEDALDLAERHASTINLVLTDLMMPKRDGFALVNLMREIVKDVPVLFITGYSNQSWKEHGISPSEVLSKPVTPILLATRVRQALDARKPEHATRAARQ